MNVVTRTDPAANSSIESSKSCRNLRLTCFLFDFAGALEDENVIDFTSAIAIPLPDGVAWVEGPNGLDGVPAFQFASDSAVVRPARSIVPLSFPSDFAITVTVRPENEKGGVIFAVTSEDSSKVYLAVDILPVRSTSEVDGSMIIRFIYLNPYFENRETFSFKVNEFANKWTRFALSKKGKTVTMHFECGDNVYVKVGLGTGGAFILPGTSLFHLGRAGNNTKYGVFEVSMSGFHLFQFLQGHLHFSFIHKRVSF